MRTYATTAVRDALTAHLKGDAEVLATGATIVARERGQLLSAIQVKLANLKLGVVVLPCEIVRVNPNTEPPLIEELRVAVAVSESKLNDGPEAEEVAELLLAKLHALALPTVGPEVTLYAEPKPTDYAEAGPLNVVTIAFRCTGLPAAQS